MNDIFEAIDAHLPDEVDRLLLSGVDPNVASTAPPIWFPLEAAIEAIVHDAAPEVVLRMVQSLIRHGADVNAWDRERELTPLLKAMSFRTPGVVELLLESGADPNVFDQDRDTPLMTAIRDSDLALARKLLEHGAARSINEAGTYCYWPVLHLAVFDSNAAAVDLLLEYGADPNGLDEDRGTPLERAIRKSDLALARTLLAHGATRVIDDPVWGNGINLLHLAVDELDLPTASLLLEMGANPAALCTDGTSVRQCVPPEDDGNRQARQDMLKLIDQYLAKPRR